MTPPMNILNIRMNATASAARAGKLCCLLGTLILAAGCTTVEADRGAAAGATHAHATTDRAGAPDLESYLQAFPPAAPGQKRWVIVLPQAAREDLIQVELLPAVRMLTDCNHHLASAKVQSRTADGWGYTYDVMEKVGPAISTLMGCPDNEKQARDVPVEANLALRRYNSRAPIVFYAPEEVTLRYRLWRTQGEAQTAEAIQTAPFR